MDMEFLGVTLCSFFISSHMKHLKWIRLYQRSIIPPPPPPISPRNYQNYCRKDPYESVPNIRIYIDFYDDFNFPPFFYRTDGRPHRMYCAKTLGFRTDGHRMNYAITKRWDFAIKPEENEDLKTKMCKNTNKNTCTRLIVLI